MLLQVLEISVELASITAIVLPIIAVCFFIIVTPWLKDRKGGKLRRYLSYIITPPRINATESNEAEENSSSRIRNDKVKLYFYYLGIVLFMVSFVIGEFYEVMFDLLLPVNQGSTGEYRTATTIVFESLFNAGWIGEMPWFEFSTYHETWDWIFFTTALTDNPNFLSTIISVLLLISVGVGLVFLSPLAIRSIRQSFVSSMFFFMTGMTIFTKTATGYFAGAFRLLYSPIEFPYTLIAVNSGMIPNYTGVITSCILLILPMFILFIILGRRLWRVYYSDAKSRNRFTMYITLCFWLGVILTMVV